jgi:hypothetical protein
VIQGFFGQLIAKIGLPGLRDQGVLNLQDRITGAVEAELAREPG